jgi:hypothetical protein
VQDFVGSGDNSSTTYQYKFANLKHYESLEYLIMKAKLTFIFILFIAFASGSAMARGHGGGGHGGGGRFSFFVGVPLLGLGLYPYYAPYYSNPSYGYPAPDYGYPPVAAAPNSPQAYVEQGNTPPPQQTPVQAQGNWWYYCGESKAYYPYVRECPAGWEHVSPQPPTR